MWRNLKVGVYLACVALLVQSCQTLRESSKFGFNEGWYKSRIHHRKLKSVYVVPGSDSIKIYTRKQLQEGIRDTAHSIKIAFPASQKPDRFENYLFRQNTFDINLLTVLFKYRPATGPFQRQISTSFNGVVYFGRRTDLYRLQYHQTPLLVFKRRITHYAFSMGAFTGIGTGSVSATTTRNVDSVDYEGVVNLSGVAVILAAERIKLGLTLGFDHLLDKYHKVWLYEEKPWFGISVGLSLN